MNSPGAVSKMYRRFPQRQGSSVSRRRDLGSGRNRWWWPGSSGFSLLVNLRGLGFRKPESSQELGSFQGLGLKHRPEERHHAAGHELFVAPDTAVGSHGHLRFTPGAFGVSGMAGPVAFASFSSSKLAGIAAALLVASLVGLGTPASGARLSSGMAGDRPLEAPPVFGTETSATLLAQGGGSTQRSKRGSVASDVLLNTPSEAAPDLILSKEGERKSDALAAFAQGVAAEENGDTERALEAYRRSLALDPAHTDLAVKIGLELVRRDQIPEGIDVLKDAAKAAPKTAIPPLCLSQIYAKFLKKPQLAERYAQEALSLEPKNFAPYLALFDLYITTGQQRKATAILDRASKVKSEDPEFWLNLADIQARVAVGQRETPNPDELPQIQAALKKALEYAKDDPALLVKAADLYEMIKEGKEAIPLYQKATADPTALEATERINAQDKLARLLLHHDRRDEAIAVLEEIMKAAPTRYETYEQLGELYTAAGQFEQATAAYQQALLVNSSNPNHYIRIANLQLEQRKATDAVATLQEARRRFPGIARISYSLAIALGQAKQSQEALTMFAQSLHEAEQTDATLLDGRFFFNYGMAAEQGGNLEAAADLLRKSIQMDPSHAAEAYNYLGYMWADRGNHLQEALDLIEHALALDPENGAYLDSLGWCYFKLGNFQSALEYLHKAVERLEPPDPVVFDHLGDTYSALGKPSEAIAQWKRALDLDPSGDGFQKKIAEAERKIASEPASATAAPSPTPDDAKTTPANPSTAITPDPADPAIPSSPDHLLADPDGPLME